MLVGVFAEVLVGVFALRQRLRANLSHTKPFFLSWCSVSSVLAAEAAVRTCCAVSLFTGEKRIIAARLDLTTVEQQKHSFARAVSIHW